MIQLPVKAVEQPGGLSPKEQERVNAAIDRGCTLLRRTQQPDGSWTSTEEAVPNRVAGTMHALGYTALAGLALLECWVPPSDPAITKAADFVRLRSRTNYTYHLSLAILFLDRLGQPKDLRVLRSMAMRLASGQKRSGGWGYSCPALTPFQEETLMRSLRRQEAKLRHINAKSSLDSAPNQNTKAPSAAERPVEGATPNANDSGRRRKWAEPARANRNGTVTYGGLGQDNSNTQFALIALWACRRHGLPVCPLFARSESYFRFVQYERGWGYLHNEPPTGSMTCVGLLALALGRGSAPVGEKPDYPPSAKDEGITQGLWALGGYLVSPSDNKRLRATDAKANLDLYFLWSVERVGVLCNLETIGDVNWYRWGVGHLLRTQRADGSWFTRAWRGSDPTLDTSLALLFLKRADLLPGLKEQLRLRVAITDPGADAKAGSQRKDPASRPSTPLKEGVSPQKTGPRAVNFKEGKAGMPTERRIVLRCATPFRISGIAGTDNYLQAKTDRERKTEHVLTIMLQPSEPGELTRTLHLRTDLPGQKDVPLILKVRVVR